MIDRTTRPAKWAVFFILSLAILSGCRKPDEDLGLELLPGDPLGVTGEEAAIHAYTFQDSAIRTSGLTRNLLGAYVDPEFGLVKAGLVAQLRLSSSNVGQGQNNDGLVADSLVLSLIYDATATHYGALGAQRFEVYEVSEDLSVDTVYQSNDIPEILTESLVEGGSALIVPDPIGTVVVGGDTVSPQLRIRLTSTLAERFLDAFGTADLADNNAFLQFFKGLYVKVENGPQSPLAEGVLYFDLLNAGSKVTLHYHDTDLEPKSYEFPITENSVRYTVSEFDRSQATDPGLQAALADTVAAATKVYLQALSGPRVAVRMPGILDYAVQGRALAKAELIVPIHGEVNELLPPPALVFLFRRDETGADAFLPDQLGGVGTIDGNYRPDEKEFRFNVTRYVQGVLNGDIPANGFEMVASSNGVTANRAVLAGPAAEEGRMRLLLTFTTY